MFVLRHLYWQHKFTSLSPGWPFEGPSAWNCVFGLSYSIYRLFLPDSPRSNDSSHIFDVWRWICTNRSQLLHQASVSVGSTWASTSSENSPKQQPLLTEDLLIWFRSLSVAPFKPPHVGKGEFNPNIDRCQRQMLHVWRESRAEQSRAGWGAGIPCVDPPLQSSSAHVTFCTRVCESLTKLGFCSDRIRSPFDIAKMCYMCLKCKILSTAAQAGFLCLSVVGSPDAFIRFCILVI